MKEISKLIDSFFIDKDTGKELMKYGDAIECTENMLNQVLEIEDERFSNHDYWKGLKVDLEEVKKYGQKVTLEELKGHYKSRFMKPDDFIHLVTLWHEDKTKSGYRKAYIE